tara:strand:+ start:33 stop:812 length:780 start_codon:yes stop_codon:yes gene_type:complete
MKDILVIYPHGLGDCVLLTPALREFYKKTGQKVHIATLARFQSAQFFDNNPYVDKIYYTKDAWLDYPSSHVGFNAVYNDWKKIAKEEGFQGVVMPMHSEPINKILLNFRFFGLAANDQYQTEFFSTPEDQQMAAAIVKDKVGDSPFGFVQTSTGVPSKDLPPGFGRHWLQANKGVEKIIEIGQEIDQLEYNINVQFEILRLAAAVCIPDSVFYHACHAMNKEIDLVYFGRGQGIYDRVRPLWEVKENVVFLLEDEGVKQ